MSRAAKQSPAPVVSAPESVPAGHTRAVALVGFYRGAQLVMPGERLVLPDVEFSELRGFHKVDFAPAPDAAPQADLRLTPNAHG